MNTAVAQKHLADAIVAKVRRRILQKAGENCIRGLSRALGVTDDDGVFIVSKANFIAALQDYGIELSPEEMRALTTCYDRNNTGGIVATEFLAALRGGMNPARRALVQRVFDLFEKTADGSVALKDIRGRYDPSAHPAVLRGETSAEAVGERFYDSFDTTANPDGLITRQEFEQYCAGVSAATDDDDYFSSLMRGCWRLPAARYDTTMRQAMRSEGGELVNETFKATNGLTATSAKNFTTTQSISDKERVASRLSLKASFDALMKKHRDAMMVHKMGFRGVGRLLRQRDTEGTNYLPQEDFLDCLWKNRLYIDDKELLQFLDTNEDGTIDYGLYMASIMGTLPPARQLLLERLWRSLPTDRQGRADLSVIHHCFNAPDGVALNTFLDAWDARLVPSGKVAFVELLEWMIPISAPIASDAAFERHVKEQWRFESPR